MFFFLKRPAFSFFILIALVISGVYSIFTIGKESMPEIQIPVLLVTTVLPGASALDVEELVTNPIEDQLRRTLDDVDDITSQSGNSISLVTIMFNDSADIGEAMQQTKDEVDLVIDDLPSDAQDPRVIEISFSDSPVFVVSFATKNAFTALSETVAEIEDALLDVRGVSEVDVAGLPGREVNVILNQAKLSDLGMNVTSVIQAIGQSDIALPVGSIVQGDVEYNVTFSGDIETAGMLQDLIVGRTAAGLPIYLSEIATIEDGLEATESGSRLSVAGSVPQQAVTFSVKKQVGYDVTVLTADLEEALVDIKADLGEGDDISFVTLTDDGEAVFKDLLNLTSSALQTVVLVFVVLLVGLGMRPAVLAAISVPLSFTVAFLGLMYTGGTLNFISLFALVLVIGMLVDAAVVITEGMTNAIERGLEGVEAAKQTLTEFFGSIVAGTATTIAVFAPMTFLSGVTGQLITPIPMTVIIVLLGSLFVALAFVPLIGVSILKSNRKEPSPDSFEYKRDTLIKKMSSWYRDKLEGIITNRKLGNKIILSMVGLLVVSMSLVVFGLLKIEFFPADDFDQLTLEITMPAGSLLEQAEDTLVGVEDIVRNTPHIDSFVSKIKPTEAQIIVAIESKDYGEVVLADLREKFANYTDTEVRVVPPSSGPTSGAPFEVQFVGTDLGQLSQLASAATKIIKGIPGTADVSSSVDANSIDIELTADRAAIEAAGMTVAGVAQVARTSIFGAEATSFKHPKSNEDVDVIVKVSLNQEAYSAHKTNRINIDTLSNLPIQTPKGEVLLGSLVTIDIIEAAAKIEHDEGDRIVSVSSYVEEGVVVGDINTAFLAAVDSGELEVPEGVDLRFGGDTEESSGSMKELGISLLVGIALIVAVLIFQFNSVKKMVFVVSVIPFGLIGVLLGLFIFGQTLSFTAMVGFIALVGIVINNSIILIDVMGELGSRNSDLKEVVLEGAASRLRPILLTTATTVIGMIPLLFTSPMWTPLALAVITGLLFAVVLTLVLIPIFYYRYGTTTAEPEVAMPSTGRIE